MGPEAGDHPCATHTLHRCASSSRDERNEGPLGDVRNAHPHQAVLKRTSHRFTRGRGARCEDVWVVVRSTPRGRRSCCAAPLCARCTSVARVPISDGHPVSPMRPNRSPKSALCTRPLGRAARPGLSAPTTESPVTQIPCLRCPKVLHRFGPAGRGRLLPGARREPRGLGVPTWIATAPRRRGARPRAQAARKPRSSELSNEGGGGGGGAQSAGAAVRGQMVTARKKARSRRRQADWCVGV